MKNFTHFIFAAILGVFIFISCNNEKPKNAQKLLTIYDTAKMMLYEFVAESNDTNLGFKNADEVLRSHIAVDSAIDMYILGKGLILGANGDSSELELHTLLKKLSRKMYPVYLDSNIRAAITFDSTHAGWRPVIFENPNALIPYILDGKLPSKLSQGNQKYMIVSSQDLHEDVIMKHDTTGDYVLPTAHLKKLLAENYPSNTTGLQPIKKEDFFEGVRKNLEKKRKEKLTAKK